MKHTQANRSHAPHRPALRTWSVALALGVLGAMGSPLQAKPTVEVREAWMRLPREGFNSTVVFMTLQAGGSGAELVGASSGVAKSVALLTMARQGDTVQMAPVAKVDLPANAPVQLRTGIGSFHLMALQLKRPLKGGETVPFELAVKDKGASRARMVRVQVKVVAPANHQAGHGEEDLH